MHLLNSNEYIEREERRGGEARGGEERRGEMGNGQTDQGKKMTCLYLDLLTYFH